MLSLCEMVVYLYDDFVKLVFRRYPAFSQDLGLKEYVPELINTNVGGSATLIISYDVRKIIPQILTSVVNYSSTLRGDLLRISILLQSPQLFFFNLPDEEGLFLVPFQLC